jgi:hypothetical protein
VSYFAPFFFVFWIDELTAFVFAVIGTLCTALATLFFALTPSGQHVSYWALGFPSAILSVVGADFVFACGTLFVARVAAPEEQSLAGALFLTMTQLGTSFGLTISTIVYNRVSKGARAGSESGAGEGAHGANDAAALKGFQAAQWSALGFGLAGRLFDDGSRCQPVLTILVRSGTHHRLVPPRRGDRWTHQRRPSSSKRDGG